jgi:hypothetical protein
VLLLLLRVLLVPEKTWRCLQLSLLTKLEISTAAAAAEEEEEEEEDYNNNKKENTSIKIAAAADNISGIQLKP